jgi:hypothetical protein
MVDPIVARLIKIETESGMSSRAFARHLGVDPTLWSRVRSGKRRGARDFLERVVSKYPELGYVFVHGVQNGHDAVPNGNTPVKVA